MNISYKLKIMIMITSVSVILTSVSMFSLYRFAYENMFESVSKSLMDSLKLAVEMFDEEDMKAMLRLKEAVHAEDTELTEEELQKVYNGGVVNKLSKEKRDELQSSDDFKRVIHKLNLIGYSSVEKEMPFEEYIRVANIVKSLQDGAFVAYLGMESKDGKQYEIAATLASPTFAPVEGVWPGNPIGTTIKAIKSGLEYLKDDIYVHDEIYVDPFYTVLFGYIPIKYKGKDLAFLEIEYPVGKELNKILWLKRYSFIIVVASFLLGILLSAYISKWMTRSLSKLQDSSVLIQEHNYSVTVDIRSEDEFGMLGQSFNQMAGEVSRSVKKLEKSNERLRSVTADMHDGVGAILTSIQISTKDDPDGEAFNNLAKKGMAEVRFLMDAMEYDSCNLEVLRDGIELLAVDILKPQNILCSVSSIDANVGIPFQMYLDIQRVAREAFTNIIKHSDADECKVELSVSEDMVFMNISDNGKPLKESLVVSGEQGHKNIKLRVERYLGIFSLRQDETGYFVKTSFKIPTA